MMHDRRNKIVQMISSTRMVKVSELIKTFNVSIETIRRDLEYLEDRGYLRRVYGGAVVKSMYGLEPDYSSREIKNYPEKVAIGQKAVELVDDGDTLVIDIGTTTLEFARALIGKKKITVITNAIKIAAALVDDENIRVIMLGGDVRKGELSTSGFLSENNMSLFNVDKVFLGIGGITVDEGITDYNIEESNLRRHVLKKTHKIIGLADYSKFGVIAMNKVCDIERINFIITDSKTDKYMISKLKSLGIKVLTVDV
ncbi:MAG TPA: DeoR/GlpR family DNA-binding transcription regulator [Sedimentibacter sp.]|nr:DeoR/GlpR family DNA-binding transcription regulator [Sedimentibacter sp.]